MNLCKLQTLCIVHELTSSYSIADIPQGIRSGVASCNPSFKMAITNGLCCQTFLSNTIVLLFQDWSRNPLNTYILIHGGLVTNLDVRNQHAIQDTIRK